MPKLGCPKWGTHVPLPARGASSPVGWAALPGGCAGSGRGPGLCPGANRWLRRRWWCRRGAPCRGGCRGFSASVQGARGERCQTGRCGGSSLPSALQDPKFHPGAGFGKGKLSPRATPGMLGAGEAAAPNLTPRKSQTKVTGMVLGTSPCWEVTPMGPRPPQSHHGHDLTTSLAQPPSNASTPSDQSPLVAEPRAHTQHSFGVLLPSLLPAPRLQPPKHLPLCLSWALSPPPAALGSRWCAPRCPRGAACASAAGLPGETESQNHRIV